MLHTDVLSAANVTMIFRSLYVILLCSCLAACGPAGGDYLRNGMGSSLAANDIVQSTAKLDQYFSLLCAQAGLSSSANASAGCRMPAVDRDAWTAVVLQGMNDIDRRCDAYLEWLDDKRRSRGPLGRQINDVSVATTAIIGFADSDATKAINIVGQAFGLLAKSVENYNSRLLLEVESSTVNSIVIQERFRFRRETQLLVYSSRPAAEYALRSYTRICLPFAIETQINDLSTLGSRREVQTSDTSIYQSPAVAPVLGTSGLVATAKVNINPTGQRAPVAEGWANVSKIRIDLATAKAIQSAVCLPAGDADGTFGPRTAAQLRIFESISSTGGFRDREWRNRTIDLSQPEINELKSSCTPGALNYLESRMMMGNGEQAKQVAQEIKRRAGLTDGPDSLPELRVQIAKVRKDLHLDDGPSGFFSNQITPDLFQILIAPQG